MSSLDPSAPAPAAPTSAASSLPTDAEASAAILRLAGAQGGTSIDPTEVARALRAGEGWQRALPVVRRAAVQLAREGRLLIYRKGKPVDPEDFRGVYRLGLPRED